MDVKELLKQYEELEAPVLDSMEDETGMKEIVEEFDEDDELGLFIQTTGSLYDKYIAPAIQGKGKVAWDRLVREGARLYKREIDATAKFGEKEFASAKEYLQNYFKDDLKEDFKPAEMKKAEYKKTKIEKPEVEPLKEEVAEKITFKLGDADVEVTNDTKETFTAEEILKAIEDEKPAIFWNNADCYHYIMDFSFEKNGKKYWIESKKIQGDFSKFELNIYEGFNESLAGSMLKNLDRVSDKEVKNMAEGLEEKPAEMEQAEYDETKIVKPEVDENGKKAEKELKEDYAPDWKVVKTKGGYTLEYQKGTLGHLKDGKHSGWYKFKQDAENRAIELNESAKFKAERAKAIEYIVNFLDEGDVNKEVAGYSYTPCITGDYNGKPVNIIFDYRVAIINTDKGQKEYKFNLTDDAETIETVILNIIKELNFLKEEVEEDELDPEQQAEIEKAIELYKKHGMLFLEDEDGKAAYDTLYNAGYTMKKDGDVAHCVELNRLRESRADKIRKGIHKRVVREEKEQLYGVQFRDMHTAIHNLITTDSKEKAEQILDYLKELETPAEDLEPNAVADNAFITWDLINKLSIDCFEIDYRQVNDGKFEDIIVINADGPKPDIWESVDNKKGEALNETTEADINRMIEKVYGTVGNKKDEYFLQGTTIYQRMEDNGGVKRVLDASTKGKLYDLLCELKAYKNFLVDAGKLNEVKNECLGELKGHKRVKKSKLGESEEYPIKDVIETSDTIKVIVKPEFLELSLIKLFPILELGGNELSNKFIKAIKHIVNGKLIIKYEGGLTRSFTFEPNGSEKNAYNIMPGAGTIFSTVFRVYESLNEVSLDNAEDTNIKRQIQALGAEVKAEETGSEKDKKEAERLADKATKSNKLFKSWKKAKGLENKDEALNESVVAKFDNGLHEIVRTADGKYFNRYNIKEGKARFTTRPVNSLPTALGALKKRFPEAEEVIE